MFTEHCINNFWQKVVKNGPDDCWGWSLGHDVDGYGRGWYQLKSDGITKGQSTHRLVMMFQTNAFIPKGLVVMHHCDNPGCVNPKHLSIATVAANNLDKKLKGRERAPRGEKQPFALLTDEQAREIRRVAIVGWRVGRHNGSNLKELALKYGVKQELIRRIARGELYKYA
jgi:hypothetical protein